MSGPSPTPSPGSRPAADPAAVRAVLDLLEHARVRPGGVRVLGIDGRSGAGKTTLARAVRAATGGTRVALDAIYPGWDGLAAGVDVLVAEVLRPLAEGRPAGHRRWDWTLGRWQPGVHPVRLHGPDPVVIVEGVGAGARTARPLLSALVWLELPGVERRRRALARDGAAYEPHWERWAAQEERYLAADDPAAAADLVLPSPG